MATAFVRDRTLTPAPSPYLNFGGTPAVPVALGGAPPASSAGGSSAGNLYSSGSAAGADFLGEGGVAAAPKIPDDPNDAPNPNNPGGVSNNELSRMMLRQNQTNNIAKNEYMKFGTTPLSTDIVGTTTDSNGNRINIVRGTPEQDAAYNAKLGTVSSAGFQRDSSLSPGVQQLAFTPPGQPQAAPAQGGSALADNGTTVGSAQTALDLGQKDIEKSEKIGAGGPAQRVDVANADVRQFLDEERKRKGSSEAEALLAKASDRIMAQSLGVAAGARGTAEDRSRATRQAVAANNSLGAQATQDLATLRAQEDAQQRDRLLNILGLLSGNAGRGDQLGAQYAGYGTQLQTAGIDAASRAEGNASNERIAGNRLAQDQYQFNNLSAADRARIAEARRNEPSFGEELLNYGTKYLPFLTSLL